ncbi:hypothetical protein [Cobetia amphilecti]|uniref:hypothetical protein n=1 Tax=Cobetia amphilecti TaxID=1055104 RepID=UPI0026E42DD2|nr:hypothetical protein [Cobetia amphilecti]MDO6815339.1 hypothetical protein [Cobetia amphilecti]
MKSKRLWLAAGAISSLMLTGCATQAITAEDAIPAPAERLYLYQSAPLSNHGKLTVTRDSGFAGSGCGVVISINGKPAAKLNQGETSSFTLPSGRVIIGASANRGICSTGLKEAKDTIIEDEEIRYRTGFDQSGSLGLFPTAY